MPINLSVKLCGAAARQNNHNPCRQPAMRNKNRCRLHGGKSSGPKTVVGKDRCAIANLKSGLHTNIVIADRRRMRMMMDWRDDLEENF